jgi:hypothetical protein
MHDLRTGDYFVYALDVCRPLSVPPPSPPPPRLLRYVPRLENVGLMHPTTMSSLSSALCLSYPKPHTMSTASHDARETALTGSLSLVDMYRCTQSAEYIPHCEMAEQGVHRSLFVMVRPGSDYPRQELWGNATMAVTHDNNEAVERAY